MKNNQSKRGSTLSELLVTVATIRILASMTLSLFAEYRGKLTTVWLSMRLIRPMSATMLTSQMLEALAQILQIGLPEALLGSTLTVQNYLPGGGGSGASVARYLQGYNHTKGVGLVVLLRELKYRNSASHCKGSARADSGYSASSLTKEYPFRSTVGKIVSGTTSGALISRAGGSNY